MSSSSSSDGERCNTPTHTRISDPFDLPPIYSNPTTSTCPWKGSTYIIRDPKTELVIALMGGNSGLYPQEKQMSGGGSFGQRAAHWHCHENGSMWLGFQNAVSGGFIGHNGREWRWRFHCQAKRHDQWEYFMTRQHPDGGHLILVKHWNSFLPMKADNGELVVERNTDAGTVWEFIKVDC